MVRTHPDAPDSLPPIYSHHAGCRVCGSLPFSLANATGLIKVTQSSGQLVSAHPLLGVTALTVLEFAEVLTHATSSLVGQSQQQGGVQAVVMGRHQLFKSDMGDQVSHRWGQGLDRFVLRAWSGQTQQPRAVRPDSREEVRESLDSRAGTSDTAEVSMNE